MCVCFLYQDRQVLSEIQVLEVILASLVHKAYRALEVSQDCEEKTASQEQVVHKVQLDRLELTAVQAALVTLEALAQLVP